MSSDSPIVIVLIPAFNEERFIASVVLTARAFGTHVIVVDDGSTDRTADLAEASGARVVRQGTNRGKAAALNAGFEVARGMHADAVVCIDGDAQHDPAEIPSIIMPILSGEADVVIGSRFLSVRSSIPKWREAGQHTLTVITNTLSGVRVTDSQSGFRAFSSTAVQALRFSTDGLSLESEMQFLFGPAGLRVVEVPISVKYLDGNKRNPFVHGLQVLDAMLSLVARRRPLIFIGVPGVAMAMLGLVLGGIVVHRFDTSGDILVGTAMGTILLIIGGLLLAVTGVMLHSIGHFVGRIREEMALLGRSAADRPQAGHDLSSEPRT